MADGYEGSDVDSRSLAAAAAVLLLAIPSLMGGLAWLLTTIWEPGADRMTGAFEGSSPVVPGPPPQAAPAADLAALKARAQTRLSGYGWVERDPGIAHIPITEAMRLLAQRRHQEAKDGG
jgi:hypothetical protein